MMDRGDKDCFKRQQTRPFERKNKKKRNSRTRSSGIDTLDPNCYGT